ncbi:hypothetical protein [Nocardia cerradoensis]|uniref:hypothetical protein n=1 Tax=Nocardia cerradoensis TaxID=85688 RepID=UPI0002D8E371|nr:hypothetical protein [Nocardia cerradoensis]NKY44378.1 hypothetical protein [Nocardia cerradoensis]
MNAPVSVADQALQPLIDWATAELGNLGRTVTGAQEMRRRDWTLLARIDTDAGAVWAKASARAFAHEGPLLEALDRLVPDAVPKPLAVHRENGWFLARDGGETMRTGPLDRQFALDGSDAPPPRPPGWESVLRSYAALQHTLCTHAESLRDTGTPYLPPARLIDVYRHFADRAPRLESAIESAAAELARYDRLSVEHNDLYPGHVFRTTAAVFDWGDALITHPFLSVRTFRDPQRAAYFDAWRELATVTDREIELAERLAPLTTLHSWLTIDTAPGRPAERFAPFVTEMLDRLRANFA